MSGQSVVEVAANSQVEVPVAFRDRILNVQGQLLDVGVAVEDDTSLLRASGRRAAAGCTAGLAVPPGPRIARIRHRGTVLGCHQRSGTAD